MGVHNESVKVFRKMYIALKDYGIIYISFKYGDFEGERKGRYFIDFSDSSFQEFMREIPELILEEAWVTYDVRPGRDDER